MVQFIAQHSSAAMIIVLAILGLIRISAMLRRNEEKKHIYKTALLNLGVMLLHLAPIHAY